MRSSSPAVKSSKLDTLPADLKAIAEEMLREKFDESEVVAEKPKRFRAAPEYAQTAEPYDMGKYQRGFPEVQVRYNPWGNNRIASVMVGPPSRDSLARVMRVLNSQGIPTENRTWVFSPQYWNYLKQNPEFRLDLHQGISQLDRLFGIPIKVTPAVRNGFLEAEF